MNFLKNRVKVTLRILKVINSKDFVRLVGVIPFNNQKVTLTAKVLKTRLGELELKNGEIYDLEGHLKEQEYIYDNENINNFIDVISICKNVNGDKHNKVSLVISIKDIDALTSGSEKKLNKVNFSHPSLNVKKESICLMFGGNLINLVKSYKEGSILHTESFFISESKGNIIKYNLSAYKVTHIKD